MRIVDLQLSFPAILLALVLAALLGQGKTQLITALVDGAVRLFRPHRASAPPPPSAARTMSRPPPRRRSRRARIVFRHLLPNSCRR